MRLLNAKVTLEKLTTELLISVVSPADIESKKREKSSAGSVFNTLDGRFSGQLRATLLRAEFKPVTGSHFLFNLHDPHLSALLMFVWEVRSQNSFDSINLYRKLGAAIQGAAAKLGAKNAALSAGPAKFNGEPQISALLQGIILSGYSYDEYKSKKIPKKKLEELSLLGASPVKQEHVSRTIEMCAATMLARDLINMPPNDCTPPYLVKVAKAIAAKGKLKIQIFDKAQLTKMGANSFLSVAKGTVFPPYLIKLSYIPANRGSKTKVVSLVGKGITYDTGGYSLKPNDSMAGMKGDMGGAATVLGVMQLASRLKPRCEVRGYIPTTENMISGEATRVGDIVTAMNGKTIEILNTDAEGRLILADALVLACRDRADYVIDLATLTGACVVALGLDYAGLFSDNSSLAQKIIETGEIEGERYWRLPLAPEYRDSIKSKTADLKNISGSRWAGATIGGLFLQEFVTDCEWAHIDIAGPSDSEKDSGHIKQGGVGFGVRTLGRFLLQQ